MYFPRRRGWRAAGQSSVPVMSRRGIVVTAPTSSPTAAAVPAMAAAAVRVSAAGEEPGVAAVGADRTEEVFGVLVEEVAAVAHPHRPFHPELRQGHAVARAPVAKHEPAISEN